MKTEAYHDALQTLLSLGAERALVLQGPQPLKLRAAHGLLGNQPWSDQVSLGLLERTLEKGECLLLGDAQVSPMGERWSVAVNQIRSVLCVPFWSPSSRIMGVLYVDTLSKAGVFSKKTMEVVQACARTLERSLYGGSAAPLELPPPPPPSRPAVLPPTAPAGALGLRARSVAPKELPALPARLPLPSGRPDARELTVFFRSLAVMIEAGMPLYRSLDLLARGGADKKLCAVAQGVASKVAAGSAVSAAMTYYPEVFSGFDVSLVRLGEKSGSLPSVLQSLATHRERVHDSHLRMRSALTYPALILTVCTLMLVLGPPYLMHAQFQVIRESHQAIPWITRALMLFSDAVRSPWGLPTLALAMFGAIASLRFAWRSEVNRERGYRWAGRLPGLGRALNNLATARFAGSLALTSRAGVPFNEALTLSAQSTEDPRLQKNIARGVQQLVDGGTLAQCMEAVEFFPRVFVQVVRAGQETGKVDELMQWAATFYETELNAALDTFLSLIEPVLMLGMGILVGLVLLATLLPMVNVLEGL